MEPIVYNGRKYRKRKDQKYFCCSRAKGIYSRYLHRQMWYDKHGTIPQGFQVHHLNHDSLDNRMENLGILGRREHMQLHSRERVKKDPEFFIRLQKAGIKVAPLWHASKEGNEWHRNHWAKSLGKSMKDREHVCEYCGNKHLTKASRTRFCSEKCGAAWRRHSGIDDEVRKCKKCGIDFMADKYQRNVVNCHSCRRIKTKSPVVVRAFCK